jgi:hypothetical protein
MAARCLIFFPHNPWPPRSGAHQRGLAVVAALRTLGHPVTFASSTFSSETAWTAASQADTAQQLGAQVEVYTATPADRRYVQWLTRAYQRLRRPVPVNSSVHTPPGMRRWFRRVYAAAAPGAVLMNYAYWDGLISRALHRGAISVMDTLDLISLHARMRVALEACFPAPPFRPEAVPAEILEEDFFARLHLDCEPGEYRAFDRYAHTLAVTAKEAERIRANTRHTRVSLVPITYPAQTITTDYTGPALFATGPNSFNLQGYLYFAGRALPAILPAAPDFALHVTGRLGNVIAPRPGIVLRGFVDDLPALYREAAFAVCPVLGKTGQQVKIVEAMAYGLPVVAIRNAAEGSPIIHGETGFIAENAAELAEHTLRLWQDRALCRRLGQAGHALIAREYSTPQLAQRLAPVVAA